MAKERKPSKIIEEFIQLLETAQAEYDRAKKTCSELDSIDRHIYWAHKFEFAKDKSEKAKLGTAYQKERRERRKAKDVVDLYKAISEFARSENNKPILKRLRGALNTQKNTEEYLEQRGKKGGENNADN